MTMHDRALRLRDALSMQYVYNNPWDAQKIQGCICDRSHTGYDCSRYLCPTGDDPLTTKQLNEIQLLKCQADAGSFVVYYNGVPSGSIKYNANQQAVTKALLATPGITGIKVTYTLGNITAPICSTEPQVITIEFTDQFGPQPPLVPQANEAMTLAGGFLKIAADGKEVLTNPGSNLRYLSTRGSKENSFCSGRGLCDASAGSCLCYNTNGDAYDSSNGYGFPGTRGDCGYIKSGLRVSTCPGEVQCSGHGICQAVTYQCKCNAGWEGGDCSLISCPKGRSWYDYPTANNVAHTTLTTCADKGLCDFASGACTCDTNYFGEACQYLTCPSDSTYGTCTGHGRCLSMKERAMWAENNGDATVLTYGKDPNNAQTWDAGRIYSCMCDKGYHGFDCSLKNCPGGDDPATYNDHVEVQLLVCKATDGHFYINFRQASSDPIPFDATATQMQVILEAMPTLGPLSIYFSRDNLLPNSTLKIIRPALPKFEGKPVNFKFNPNRTATANYVFNNTVSQVRVPTTPACATDGKQTIIIQFDTIHGNLPAIIPGTRLLVDNVNGNGNDGSGTVKVYRDGGKVNGLTSILGTTENMACNNRGLCDEASGKCQCFKTWSSSDGRGGAGDTGDCGYRNDMLYSHRDQRLALQAL